MMKTTSGSCLGMLRERREYGTLEKRYPIQPRGMQDKFLEEIKVAKEACRQNPDDTKWLKKWASALIKLRSAGGPLNVDQTLQWLREAKSILEKVLEIDEDDYDAIYHLGIVHYYTLQFDLTMRSSSKTYVEFVEKGIEFLEKVRDKVPEAYKVDIVLKSIQNFLPCDSSDLLENLRRWGSALILSYFHGTVKNRKEMIKGAVDKFNKALLLEPDDVFTKLQLTTARRLCIDPNGDRKAEHDRLLEEAKQLRAELWSLRKAESKARKRAGVNGKSRPSFHLRAPTIIASEPHKYNPSRHFCVDRQIDNGGGKRLGIAALAMQLRQMRNGGTRFRIATPAMQILLQRLISRK